MKLAAFHMDNPNASYREKKRVVRWDKDWDKDNYVFD